MDEDACRYLIVMFEKSVTGIDATGEKAAYTLGTRLIRLFRFSQDRDDFNSGKNC